MSCDKEKRKSTDAGKSGTSKKVKTATQKDKDHVDVEVLSLLLSVNDNYRNRDPISTFGQYVADKIRNLSSKHLQSLAQIRIHQLLFDLEMEATVQPLLTCPNPEPTPAYMSQHTSSSETPSPYPPNICTPEGLVSPQQEQNTEVFFVDQQPQQHYNGPQYSIID